MKPLYLFPILASIFAACSTSPHARNASAKSKPETVLVTYHVKPGNETQFQAALARAWETYRRDNLVFAKPHLILRDTEDGEKPRFIEIFTWIDRSTPEHAPERVLAIWKEEESLCEKRHGHYGIEPGEVELILPSK